MHAAAGSGRIAAGLNLACGRRDEGDLLASKSKKCLKCEDCYFRQNMLCALNLDAPCPTYRPAERGLAPERQLSFVFRTERTRAAYAFPAASTRFAAPAAAVAAQG